MKYWWIYPLATGAIVTENYLIESMISHSSARNYLRELAIHLCGMTFRLFPYPRPFVLRLSCLLTFLCEGQSMSMCLFVNPLRFGDEHWNFRLVKKSFKQTCSWWISSCCHLLMPPDENFIFLIENPHSAQVATVKAVVLPQKNDVMWYWLGNS